MYGNGGHGVLWTALYYLIAALIAVTARELLVAVAFFAFHRDLRRGHSVGRGFVTYAPAVAALFLLRYWASTTNLGDRDRPLLTARDFVANLANWLDPPFVLFFTYFLITLLGGVTVLLALRPAWCVRQLACKPELGTFAVLIVAAASTGIDIWRYLVFSLPVLTMRGSGAR